MTLSKHQSPLWLWNRAAQLSGGFYPFLDYSLMLATASLYVAPSAAHPGNFGTSTINA